MSALVSCLLFVVAYYFAYLPEVRKAADAEQRALKMQKERDAANAARQKALEDQKKQQSASALRATLVVNSKPTGASVTIGNSHEQTPFTFKDLVPGTVTVLIQADGYEDFRQDVTVTSEKPTDLGTIELVQKTGSLSLSSPQSEVDYKLTGPGGYAQEGELPVKLEKMPVGDYQLKVRQHDWELPPVTLTIHDRENVQKEIKFPYANASIDSVPPGATVREGHTILGKTPLALSQLRPGEIKLSIDLPPYAVQWLTLQIPDFGNVSKRVMLQKDKDFIAASGIAMVWIPEGGFWAGKYDVKQGEFEIVNGSNPSTFRGPNRPVETISWDGAMAFCEKLTQYERKAGKLPPGYHYSLPTESQWELFSADADIDQAPMSRSTTLSSTQNVGASEPNKYGLYDTLGNVWEWCLDAFDDKGDHSLRGGSWLSSAENFPSAETRQGAPPKYADRFTGFRVVLVPD